MFYSTFLFAVIIQFSTKLGNILLILVFLFCCLSFSRDDFTLEKKVLLVKSTAVFFILYFLGGIVSKDFSITFNQIGKKIPYLFSPLFILIITKKNRVIMKAFFLKGLVIGSVFSSIVLIINNFYEYYLTRPFLYLDFQIFNFYYTNYNYTNFFDIHPVYLGSYYLLSLCFLLFTKFNQRILPAIGVVIILISIVFINSRIIFFLTFCVFIIAFYKKYSSFKYMLVLISCFVLLFLSVFNLSSFKKTHIYRKVVKELKWDLTDQVNTEYGDNFKGDSRFSRWKVAFQLVKKSPLVGYGLGSEKKVLTNGYKNNNLMKSYSFKYDSHNQFLSFCLQFGLIGFLTLVYFFISNFYNSIVLKDDLYFVLFLITFSICLFENYLNNNAGIIYVSFVSSLFLLCHDNINTIKVVSLVE